MKTNLVPIAVIVALMGLVVIVCFTPRPFKTIYSENVERFKVDGVPDFELINLKDGSPFKLYRQSSELILVNFWASWCAPCLEEFDPLVELASFFKPSELLVVAISEDVDSAKLTEFLKEKFVIIPTNFVVLSDKDGAVAARYGTKKLPETYFVDKSKKLKMKIISSQNWKSYDVKKYFSSFLSLKK